MTSVEGMVEEGPEGWMNKGGRGAEGQMKPTARMGVGPRLAIDRLLLRRHRRAGHRYPSRSRAVCDRGDVLLGHTTLQR